jgi:hypothetical protein
MLSRYCKFYTLNKLNYRNIQKNFIQSNFIQSNFIQSNFIQRNLNISCRDGKKLNIKTKNNYDRTLKQYLKIIKLSDVILHKLDLNNEMEKSSELNQMDDRKEQKNISLKNISLENISLEKTSLERISLELAFFLDIFYVNNENELLKIINLISEVKSNHRKEVITLNIKKILDEGKYDNDEFSSYIDEIYKLKKDNYNNLKLDIENFLKLKKLENLENDKNKVFYNKTSKIRNPYFQHLFRKQVILRYNRCIISDMCINVCDAAHIIPFSETLSFDVDNGILLNSILHRLFDKSYWSINPQTLCVELFIDEKNSAYDILKPYENKYIECLKHYPKSIKNISIHYYNITNLLINVRILQKL